MVHSAKIGKLSYNLTNSVCRSPVMKIQSPSSNILNQTQQTGNKLLEQLATGKKVNSAADDAAALQIIDRLTSQQNCYGKNHSKLHRTSHNPSPYVATYFHVNTNLIQ